VIAIALYDIVISIAHKWLRLLPRDAL